MHMIFEVCLKTNFKSGFMCFTDIEQYWAAVWAFDFELNPDLRHPEENEYLGKKPVPD